MQLYTYTTVQISFCFVCIFFTVSDNMTKWFFNYTLPYCMLSAAQHTVYNILLTDHDGNYSQSSHGHKLLASVVAAAIRSRAQSRIVRVNKIV
jgi:hypothetical protein